MNKNEIESRISKCILEAKIELSPKLEISSLSLVSLAVKLEKEFQVRFELDEINADNFSSVRLIQDLIMKKRK